MICGVKCYDQVSNFQCNLQLAGVHCLTQVNRTTVGVNISFNTSIVWCTVVEDMYCASGHLV